MGIHRVSFCWRCKKRVDNEKRDECVKCGWIKCRCGACGCGYNRSSPESHAQPSHKEPTEVRDSSGLRGTEVQAVIKCQKKIKQAFEKLNKLEQVEEEEALLSFFQQTHTEMKKEFGETIYFFDLLWLMASEIKDLMKAKEGNPMMAGLSQRLRNKWIRLAPGDLSRGAKAFWGLNNEEWNMIRNDL